MPEKLSQFDNWQELEGREEIPKVGYHGSKLKLAELRRRRATAPEGRPEFESRNAIYVTPDFDAALAFAARPEGNTEIDHSAKTIHFENPEAFDPEREVYVYEIDLTGFPRDKVELGETQYGPQVAVDVDEIKVEPGKTRKFKAGDVFKYFHAV